MANNLPLEKKAQIIQLLVEGNSMRSTSRIADVSINTVSKLLVDVGNACRRFHNDKVMKVDCKKIQCDEIWSFVYAKEKNVPEEQKGEVGDVWTWTAIDAETKLMVSWYVGIRDTESAHSFMWDLARRLKDRIQLTSDGHHPYLKAIKDVFGTDIDYGRLIKMYGKPLQNENRYSPAECVGCEKKPVIGNPEFEDISTSYAERQNLTMRMSMRRFTRLTNAFSKKLDNHCHAIALHFVYYNWSRIHKSLRVTPAMQAGLTNQIMEISDIVMLTEKYPKPEPGSIFDIDNLSDEKSN